MQRLTYSEIKTIKDLYPIGFGVVKLSKLLGRRKSTVYYHIKKRFGKRNFVPYFNENLKKELGEFIGAFAGDGNLYLDKNGGYRIRFYFGLKEERYVEYITNIILALFNKRSRKWYSPNEALIVLSVDGKKICEVIKSYLNFSKDKSYTVRLKNKPDFKDEFFLKYFIRGLIASDGTVGFNRIRISTISKKLARQCFDILRFYGIKSAIRIEEKGFSHRTLYVVDITNKENFQKFREVIGLTEENKKFNLDAMLKGIGPKGIRTPDLPHFEQTRQADVVTTGPWTHITPKRTNT